MTVLAGPRQGVAGCAGAGGGNTSDIAATMSCGLPPPGAAGTQNRGDGVRTTGNQQPLGSKCISTVEFANLAAEGLPSREALDIFPALARDPSGVITATGTIHSPLPIGSPDGPHDVSVSPQTVKTAAQLNADSLAEAAGIAAALNGYQQQQVQAATASTAFDVMSTQLHAIIAAAPYAASSFYVPASPPVPGSRAAAEDTSTWTVHETVYLRVGRVVEDPIGRDANGIPQYGPEYCSELAVVATEPPSLDAHITPTVNAYRLQIDPIADSIWHDFRRGAILSEPAAGNPTYVGLPTCVGLDTGLPTGSRTPNPFTLTLPLTLQGVAGSLPVTVSGRVAVSIIAGGVHWDFNDPSGDTAVHGQDSPDATPPSGAPAYDAAGQRWLGVDWLCSVYHQYRSIAAAPGVRITASEHFAIHVSGAYNNGTATPVTFGYDYEPPDSPVTWSAGPYPVYQIEAVPFTPGR